MCFYLQDGAIDLLRELKNMKMSLETLQVSQLDWRQEHVLCWIT